ncbi:MAG TPA: sucrase ferredoxin [Nocardioides sp.]|nr:sucrase ferredoxin [Nocardioides sp.]
METRCSVLSAARDEPMTGTGFSQGGVLLVEQPGAWGRTGLSESGFDPDVAAALQRRADEHDLRLLAIRRTGRTAPRRRAWAVRPRGATHTTWSEYDGDGELLDVPLDGSVGTPSERATYLVCTHAKRDQCCAVFARPIAAALEALRPGDVWGCSHTGGHRFAPVVVALPAGVPGGVLYGRVAEDDLLTLIAATERGRVVPERLRGQIGQPAHVQAALVHLQATVGGLGLDDWVPTASEAGEEGRWRVTASGPDGPRTVLVEAVVRPEPFVSCGKPGPESQTHYAVSVEDHPRG